MTGWWFGSFFIFTYIGNSYPNWLIFFRGVETTNQMRFWWLFSTKWDSTWFNRQVLWKQMKRHGDLKRHNLNMKQLGFQQQPSSGFLLTNNKDLRGDGCVVKEVEIRIHYIPSHSVSLPEKISINIQHQHSTLHDILTLHTIYIHLIYHIYIYIHTKIQKYNPYMSCLYIKYITTA